MKTSYFQSNCNPKCSIRYVICLFSDTTRTGHNRTVLLAWVTAWS